MSALPLPKFEIQTASQLVDYLQSAVSWREVEALTLHYPDWKNEAWEMLSEEDRERIKALKKWANHPLAQRFPPYSTVQRLDDSEGQTGKVINYWSAYGIDYITFSVGQDIDWCRASQLKKVRVKT